MIKKWSWNNSFRIMRLGNNETVIKKKYCIFQMIIKAQIYFISTLTYFLFQNYSINKEWKSKPCVFASFAWARLIFSKEN